MATTLASQLAQIRVQSTNALDLKAQKKAHSKSLLFDAHHAATQDFDTLFQICYEGYQELCWLDQRFLVFAGNVFSDQSKQEDRTQMTAAQNKSLDNVLEDFMHLLSSRLLLKPAIKAMEWLVRRFSVHQYNMTCFVLTFMPYHTSSIFLAALAILPEQRPAGLRFLQPYVQSSLNPPRHTIVHSAAHNQDFFDAFNTYTLNVCRHEKQYPALLSFWSSIISEAVALMLDRSRLGRLELQKQNHQDVIVHVLPLLSEGLSLQHVPDLRVGCYMILTVLCSKANLSEILLTITMDMVVSGWDGLTHAGLICLVVLSQQRQAVTLSHKIFKALLTIKQLSDDLILLKQHYKVEKLVLGLILGSLKRLGKSGNTERLHFVRVLLESDLMQSSFVAAALTPMLRLSQGIDSLPHPQDDFDTRSALVDLLLYLIESETVGSTIQLSLENMDAETRQIGLELFGDHEILKDTAKLEEKDEKTQKTAPRVSTARFEELVSRIPLRTAFEISLLSHSNSYIFASLADVFLGAYPSPEDLDAFSEISLLRKSLAMVEPLYFSFFVRIWCGHYPAAARAAAIRLLVRYVGTVKLIVDVQMLLPYTLYALADPSSLVRRAASELILALAPSYSAVDDQNSDQSKLNILGKGQIYGQGKQSKEVAWLPWGCAVEFIQDWLVPKLEEFRLEPGQVLRSLVDRLNAPAGPGQVRNNEQKTKSSLRSSILGWLCSHVVSTPVFSFKARLLPALISVPTIGQMSTITLLKPLLTATLAQDYDTILETCKKEHIDASLYIVRVMQIATPKDKESVKLLQDCVGDPRTCISYSLHVAALRRLRDMWPLLKPQMQVSLGRLILDLVVSHHPSGDPNIKQTEALDTLRTVKLSTDVLRSLLEDCPSLAQSGTQKAAKRRRTTSPPQALGKDIKRISVILEIMESSATEADLSLVGSLFKVLTDLQGYKEHSGLELHYLQLLAMNSILSILEHPTTLQIEKSDVRADVLVECIRNSSNPQVQQTALLLVSTLASLVPELIVHNVMPIFTFMNTGVLKRTDDYSAHVVKQTMDSVIPRVMDSLRKRHKDSLAGVSELLLSFAGAFEHVPPQRRLALFQSLMDMIGVDEFLFALLILLHNKFPHNKRALQFSVDLLDCYEARTQIQEQTVERYVAAVLDSLKPKPTFSAHLYVADPSSNSPEAAMDLLSHLLNLSGVSRFVSKVSQAFAQKEYQDDGLRPLLSRVIDQILSLSRQQPQSEEMDSICQKLLDILLGGLPMVDFVTTLQGLLEGADVQVSKPLSFTKISWLTGYQTSLDALKSFELRLVNKKVEPVAGHSACLGFLRKLISIIQESEDESTKRVALACVDYIVEHFGKKDVGAVISVTHTLVGTECLRSANMDMHVRSLLSLATTVEVLGDDFIPFIPQTLPESLNSLNSKLDDGICSKRLHNACYSFFSALLLYTPWAIAKSDLDFLLHVSHGSANADLGEDCSEERRATLGLIAKQIESKNCCAALGRTWANAMTEGPEALKEHLWVVETLIGRLSKSAVGRQSEGFASLLIRAFDLRRIQFSNRTDDSYVDTEVEEVEEVTNQVAIAMIYKINDTMFRPIFTQLVDWAASSSAKAKVHRHTTLYNFLIRFFDELKSIVTSYAGLIADDAAEILRKAVVTDSASKILWAKVIQTLQKCFTHDQDGFWQSPAHFGPISKSLLDQLKLAAEVPMTSEVIPSITELAVAADSPSHHKVLNATILKYTRSNSTAVRLAAVHCQQSLTSRLGEEWLSLLPEMLPFISELQEDDDEKVEQETLRWIKKIEEVLGESLNPMLQ
ncbi:MAG: hypothetical protein Q9166_007456 [cf. Caloplaca sp. 2 TL-2023]